MPVLYEKGAIRLTDEGVTLYNYYFPTFGAKFVPYSDIKNVERISCNVINSKTWGMPFNWTWWHLDGWFAFREFRGLPGLLLHTDAITMGITPEEVDKVEEMIKSHLHQD